ncbi:MFS transporter [Peristeroidobacter agariperforans]|uniref:MFS transporter n=1 Tax=Peristeroidobacter agariperforans TaxID=268404 RepID=UPI00101CE69C|nr:MFS transporter [Peristeroidobacter agariperforans]
MSIAAIAERRTQVRYSIIGFIFIVTSINYADRATFSIAGSDAARELGLSPIATGYILSAFAWAYAAAQIPGGALLDRFGTKRIYAGAIAVWSVFTFLQGFAGFIAGLSAVTMLFALRFLVGLAEAPSFPGNARIVAAWFPSSERGTASAIFNSAQYFSLVAFAPLMGWVVHNYGWRAVFYVMGGLGLLAALAFVRFIHDPVRHPSINQAELDYIETGGGLVALDQANASKGSAFRWDNLEKLLTNRMLLGIYLGQYCINVLTYFFATWFPIYLVKERGLNILEAGFAAAAPAMCGFIGGVLGGYASDWLLKRTGSLTIARKTPLLIGMILATLIIACVYIEQEWLVITVMALAFFGKGIASLGWAIISDVSPRQFAGLTGGVFNMFGNCAGIVTPIVIGYLVAATGSFDSALIFVGVHCLLTIFAYFVIVGPIRRLELQ